MAICASAAEVSVVETRGDVNAAVGRVAAAGDVMLKDVRIIGAEDKDVVCEDVKDFLRH